MCTYIVLLAIFLLNKNKKNIYLLNWILFVVGLVSSWITLAMIVWVIGALLVLADDDEEDEDEEAGECLNPSIN